MIKTLRHFIQGVVVILIVTISTTLLTAILCVLALFKILTPAGPARNAITHWSSSLGELWVSINKAMAWPNRAMWDIHMPD
ncbi:MAG: hypothetical protein KJO80_06540, partial [Gammaproteobacteria bacterium]|nr:hypothetical protein [Gammaproteobacteria bacterium]